mmetsp:Transcript_64769/g.183755  ORF Transcript_64769/g.183755 Transcript_64769/m.183755 type:complete len:91 (+) Transcript_64769:203-475(+)
MTVCQPRSSRPCDRGGVPDGARVATGEGVRGARGALTVGAMPSEPGRVRLGVRGGVCGARLPTGEGVRAEQSMRPEGLGAIEAPRRSRQT